jgi:hypothetical protein
MYFPYLRGKQFELSALKEFAIKNPNNGCIIPIIEPIKQQINIINSTIGAMIDNSMNFSIILNPTNGDYKHIDNDILSLLNILQENKGKWIPAYVYRGDDPVNIIDHSDKYDIDQLMIIFPNGVDITNDKVMQLLKDKKVMYIVNGNSVSRSSRKHLLDLSKCLISLKDSFKVKTRNADYLDNVDEFFSEDFAFYKADNLYGFSDYTIMGKDFIEGGMLPYAIAIHLTYAKTENELYVHHFVSDTNSNQSNIKGKFHEASKKIEPFYDEFEILHTDAVDEFIKKSNSTDGYPGLGYIKKLSIYNHLELINRLLSNNNNENL